MMHVSKSKGKGGSKGNNDDDENDNDDGDYDDGDKGGDDVTARVGRALATRTLLLTETSYPII